MAQPQFSSQEEWREISDFPGYEVSSWGRIKSLRTRSYISPVTKSTGLQFVGLMQDKRQLKKSLTLLVAREFVPPHPQARFDTPINLNGDRSDNRAENLMWRPLWFARSYNKQFTDEHPTVLDPIEDVETHIVYKSSWEAAVEFGLIDQEIFASMHENYRVWPTGQIFRLA